MDSENDSPKQMIHPPANTGEEYGDAALHPWAPAQWASFSIDKWVKILFEHFSPSPD